MTLLCQTLADQSKSFKRVLVTALIHLLIVEHLVLILMALSYSYDGLLKVSHIISRMGLLSVRMQEANLVSVLDCRTSV